MSGLNKLCHKTHFSIVSEEHRKNIPTLKSALNYIIFKRFLVVGKYINIMSR